MMRGLVAVMAVTFLAGLYVWMMYDQSPDKLAVPRVRFWLAFTSVMAIATTGGTFLRGRLTRVAILSFATVGLMAQAVLAILSIGVLYVIAAGLVGVALVKVLNRTLDVFTVGLMGGSGFLAVIVLFAGMAAFPW